MQRPVCQANPLQGLSRPKQSCLLSDSCIRKRQRHVLQRVQTRQQIERLEHETDLPVPNLRKPVIVEAADVTAVQPVMAFRRCVETAEQIHQC